MMCSWFSASFLMVTYGHPAGPPFFFPWKMAVSQAAWNNRWRFSHFHWWNPHDLLLQNLGECWWCLSSHVVSYVCSLTSQWSIKVEPGQREFWWILGGKQELDLGQDELEELANEQFYLAATGLAHWIHIVDRQVCHLEMMWIIIYNIHGSTFVYFSRLL